MKKYNIAVIGATGLVGQEIVKILAERDFPINELHLFATERSAGMKINYYHKKILVGVLTENSFDNIQIALFSAGTTVSKKFAPIAAAQGTIVIDNSKAFRMEKNVPLVVPEVNPKTVYLHKNIIANPNCSTIQMVVALKPIYDVLGISRIIVSTYQAVSGTGKNAINELIEQSKAVLEQQKIPENKVYPHQISFNCLPHIDDFLENAYTLEEMKLSNETKKIFDDEQIHISATAVRVPVFIGHSESVYIETKKNATRQELLEILKTGKNLKVMDNIKKNIYPLAIYSQFNDNILVGRVRRDLDKKNAFHLWIAGNNLRKGAALNAVQIAELLIQKELV